MEKIIKFIFVAFAVALTLTACSPDDDYSIGTSNIAQDSFTFNMTPGSDEWTYNYVISFNTTPSGIYLSEVAFGDNQSEKGKLTGTHEYVVSAGTYVAKCVITLPDGNVFIKEQTITIANDNPKTIHNPLAGFDSKTWVIDGYNLHTTQASEASGMAITGFMGLGPLNKYLQGDGNNWWSAGAGDKSFENTGWTFYNWKITFSTSGALKIVTESEGYGRKAFDGNGFTSTSIEGDDMRFAYNGGDYTYTLNNSANPYPLLTLSGNAFLGYYAGSQEYEVLALTDDVLVVAVHNTTEGQDWVFVYCPEGQQIPAPPVEGNWVDVNSSDNLWHDVSFTNSFYYAPGWSQLPNPILTINGSQYSTSFPAATFEQWQNQVSFITDGLSTTSAENYDFRVTMNASNDIKQVTVKLTQADNDDIYIFTNRINLTAGQNVVLALTNMPGKDMSQVKLVFDFGGNPDDTNVVIKDVILQKHRE